MQGADVMSVTAADFKINLEKYLLMAEKEDVYITLDGKTVAKLTSANNRKLDTVNELFGSVPKTITLEESREERLGNI